MHQDPLPPDRCTSPRRAPRWRESRIAIPLVAYMGLVFLLSHMSRPPLPAVLFRLGDKLLHAIEYLPLGFLWARLFRGTARRRALLGWTAACLFGLTDELHQAFVPGREVSALDWTADAVGSGLGVLLATARQWRAEKKFRSR